MSIVAYATEWSDAPHMNLVAGRPKSPIVAVVMSGMGGILCKLLERGGCRDCPIAGAAGGVKLGVPVVVTVLVLSDELGLCMELAVEGLLVLGVAVVTIHRAFWFDGCTNFGEMRIVSDRRRHLKNGCGGGCSLLRCIVGDSNCHFRLLGKVSFCI